MASHHEINDLLDTIRKELPGRARDAYEDAVNRAMHERNKRKHHIARRMLTHSPLLRDEWRRQQEQEGALAVFMLLIGFLGGAALMYLFDPDRGSRRRAMIQVEMRRASNNISDAVEETAERVETEFNRVVNKSEEEDSQKGRGAYTTTTSPTPSVTTRPQTSTTGAAAGQSRTPNTPANDANPIGTQSPTVGTTRPPTSVTGTGGTDS